MKRSTSIAVCLTIWAFTLSSTQSLTRYAAADEAGVDASPVAAMLPDSQTAAAPSWLKPGMKITFYCASASIRGSRGQIVPAQPHEPGAFQDTRTGQWFKETEVLGTSGQSYMEVLVSGIAEGKTQLQIKDLLIVPGALCPTLYSAAVTHVGSGLDFWVNADVLKAQAQNPIKTDDLWALPVSFPLGDKTFDALRIQYQHGASIYDLQSGVLLWQSMEAQQGFLKYYLEGEGPRAGSKSLGYCRLVDSREVQFPWSNKPAPQWIGNIRQLNFTGKHTDTIPGSFTVPISETAVFEVKDRGPSWIRTTATTQLEAIGGMPAPPHGTTDGISACAAEPGAVFLPPAGLADLRIGQQLDADPTTKSTISVSDIVRRGNGVTVALSEQGHGYRADYGYDQASGMLYYIMIERQVGVATARDTFNLTGWQ